MAGAEERVLRRRISSVKATKKITRAMELIAASRVVRAQQRANAAKPYAREITRVIEDLAASGANVDHPLLREALDVRRVGLIVLSSDRGLAGAYNANVIRAAERELNAARSEGHDYDLVLVGRKAESYFRFRHYQIARAYSGFTDKPGYEDAREVADYVSSLFVGGELDMVLLVYTEFISLAVQRPVVRRFLPLQRTETIAEAGRAEAVAAYDFEPGPEEVLEALLPRYVEARLFAALLEAAASEHASRQRAMKSATDNAEEMIVKLGRQLNRARQDAITTEIMDIMGGAEGLKEDSEDPEALLVHHPFGLHLFEQNLDPRDRPHRPPLSV